MIAVLTQGAMMKANEITPQRSPFSSPAGALRSSRVLFGDSELGIESKGDPDGHFPSIKAIARIHCRSARAASPLRQMLPVKVHRACPSAPFRPTYVDKARCIKRPRSATDCRKSSAKRARALFPDSSDDGSGSDHELPAVVQTFYKQLGDYMVSKRAAAPTVYPSVLGCELNLHRLYRAVSQLGGFAAVEGREQWPAVLAICVHTGKTGAAVDLACDTRACGDLRAVYQQHLLSFERSVGEIREEED